MAETNPPPTDNDDDLIAPKYLRAAMIALATVLLIIELVASAGWWDHPLEATIVILVSAVAMSLIRLPPR